MNLTRISKLVVLTLCFTATTASALPLRSRQLACEVQNIDRSDRVLTLNCEKESQSMELIWNDDTWFVHNQEFTNSAALKARTKVRVYYRSPLFGKKFVTRVVWENGPSEKMKPTKKP